MANWFARSESIVSNLSSCCWWCCGVVLVYCLTSAIRCVCVCVCGVRCFSFISTDCSVLLSCSHYAIHQHTQTPKQTNKQTNKRSPLFVLFDDRQMPNGIDQLPLTSVFLGKLTGQTSSCHHSSHFVRCHFFSIIQFISNIMQATLYLLGQLISIRHLASIFIYIYIYTNTYSNRQKCTSVHSESIYIN